MVEAEIGEGKSLALTPTWAVATVITVMVSLGFFFQGSLKHFGKWLDKTKRKALLSALEKIKEELMLFGLLSLLMGHWIVFVAKICVKPSVLSSRFYPCAWKGDLRSGEHIVFSTPELSHNSSYPENQLSFRHQAFCPEGLVSFASYESLEQLHRLMFVLAITHISYSFIAVALAMIKIYSWRVWENQAKSMAVQSSQDSPDAAFHHRRMTRLSTFISHHTSHPWSRHGVLVWMLCFSRQFWSSINLADYRALRMGFITTHQLPLTYDFHNYMLRSMEEEFRDIVGISWPLWIYAILCIFLDFHGTHFYFWLSFLPAILILLIGTKLHRVVVKLAVETTDACQRLGNHKFNLRDELFWFGKPRLLLWLIQLISFQNAFEMATFLWSLWEIKGYSCFIDSQRFVAIRLTFGVVTQFWCSFITFPLYVIVTQMGARFKKTVVSETVRNSLHGWKRRVKARQSSTAPLLGERQTTSSNHSSVRGTSDAASSSGQGSSREGVMDGSISVSDSHLEASACQVKRAMNSEIMESNDVFVPVVPFCSGPLPDSYGHVDDDYVENHPRNDAEIDGFRKH